jgi:Zn-dependent peptidase ImmA (M78 family)
MDATEAARQEAERIHRAAVAAGDDPWNLLGLVKQEAARRDLDVYSLAPGDPALMNGHAVLDRVAGCIMHEDIGSAFDQAFLIAHELGHYVLEPGVAAFVTRNV